MSNSKAPKKKNKKTNKKVFLVDFAFWNIILIYSKLFQDGKKPLVEIPQPESHITEEMSADKLKFVCDTMLQGLGKKLRRCGIDTAILENNQDHMECVRLAQDEDRYILTRGCVFNKVIISLIRMVEMY